MRLVMIILALATTTVGLVQLRRAELIACHRTQQLQLEQVKLRRILWDQQMTLSTLVAPAEVRRRSEEMCLNLVEKDRAALNAVGKDKARPTTNRKQ